MRSSFSLAKRLLYYNMCMNIFQSFFLWCVKHKRQVIGVFKVFYLFLLIALCIVAYLLTKDMSLGLIYELGILAGKISILVFCLTITPGILRRFDMRGPIPSVLMLFRRHLGITTFALGFYHYSSIILFPQIFAGLPVQIPPPIFQFVGTLSLYTMAILFFTSNDWSVRTLGVWWGRIHNLIYLIAWGLFFHIVLQEVSLLSALIGGYACLETVSLIYYYLVRVKPQPVSDSEKRPTTP